MPLEKKPAASSKMFPPVVPAATDCFKVFLQTIHPLNGTSLGTARFRSLAFLIFFLIQTTTLCFCVFMFFAYHLGQTKHPATQEKDVRSNQRQNNPFSVCPVLLDSTVTAFHAQQRSSIRPLQIGQSPRRLKSANTSIIV
jgi:hypothetical protein